MLGRRFFLTASAGFLLADAPMRPMLLPGAESGAGRDALLVLPGGARCFCPPQRARVLADLPFRAGAVVAVRFACDTPQATQDLLALIGADGALLALERLSWQHGRASFVTRFAMLPDREHLSLERVAMFPGGGPGRPSRHESWTDYLRRDASGMSDAPVRPALAGTMQAALSAERTRLAAFTSRGAPNIPAPMLAALCSAPFEQN